MDAVSVKARLNTVNDCYQWKFTENVSHEMGLTLNTHFTFPGFCEQH